MKDEHFNAADLEQGQNGPIVAEDYALFLRFWLACVFARDLQAVETASTEAKLEKGQETLPCLLSPLNRSCFCGKSCFSSASTNSLFLLLFQEVLSNGSNWRLLLAAGAYLPLPLSSSSPLPSPPPSSEFPPPPHTCCVPAHTNDSVDRPPH